VLRRLLCLPLFKGSNHGFAPIFTTVRISYGYPTSACITHRSKILLLHYHSRRSEVLQQEEDALQSFNAADADCVRVNAEKKSFQKLRDEWARNSQAVIDTLQSMQTLAQMRRRRADSVLESSWVRQSAALESAAHAFATVQNSLDVGRVWHAVEQPVQAAASMRPDTVSCSSSSRGFGVSCGKFGLNSSKKDSTYNSQSSKSQAQALQSATTAMPEAIKNAFAGQTSIFEALNSARAKFLDAAQVRESFVLSQAASHAGAAGEREGQINEALLEVSAKNPPPL
jgi:hypothetical protein